MSSWFDYAKGVEMLFDGAPLKSIHLAGDVDYKVGDRVRLDGVSCQVFIEGDPDTGSMTASRSFWSNDCMSFWPSSMSIEAMCDEARFLPETTVRQIVKNINPRLYGREEVVELEKKIRLEHQNRAAALLK